MWGSSGERNRSNFLKVNKKQNKNTFFELVETLARKTAVNHIRKGMWESGDYRGKRVSRE